MGLKVICMTFDGEYVTERPIFETIEDAWEYAGDLGSKWIFYPFTFVVSESGKTIMDAPKLVELFVGKRMKTIVKLFKSFSQMPETQFLNAEEYAFFVMDNIVIKGETKICIA